MTTSGPVLALLAAALLLLPVTPCLDDGALHMVWDVDACTCHDRHPGSDHDHDHGHPHSHDDEDGTLPCALLVDGGALAVPAVAADLLIDGPSIETVLFLGTTLETGCWIDPEVRTRPEAPPGAAPPPADAPRCAPLLC